LINIYKYCISNDQDAFDIRERVLNNGKLKVHVTPKYPKVINFFQIESNMTMIMKYLLNEGFTTVQLRH